MASQNVAGGSGLAGKKRKSAKPNENRDHIRYAEISADDSLTQVYSQPETESKTYVWEIKQH